MNVDFNIPGIVVENEIGRGARNVIYLGSHNGQQVAVKIKKDQDATTNVDIVRFRREASALARAKHPNLPSILDTGEVGGHPYLVMEFINGESLEALLRRVRILPEARIMTLAKELASTLRQVHRYGFTHRDMKPANILIDKQDRTKVIDFEFAGDTDTAQTVGSLLYAPPEQSGMLQREVDGRSDLYSLGVVLFECATGRPPFVSEDVGELVRMHAKDVPPFVHDVNPAISVALSKVIQKLINKDPDDRYQSANGLLFDLEHLNDIAKELAAGREYPLDSESARQILTSTDIPLVGRDRELKALRESWRKARLSTGQICLIRGEPGAGKSRLTRELLHEAAKENVLVISCKCKQSEAFPFAPMRAALDAQISRARSLSPAKRATAEARLREAIGDFAGLLKRFSPLLGELLKDAPDTELAGGAKEHFLNAFSQIFIKLAAASGSLLFFIDDVQWLDESSREVIRTIASQSAKSPLLVVAAARNDEASTEATALFVEAAKPRLAADLTLESFPSEVTGKLISALLGDAPVDSSLVSQIHGRSNGNPLAVGEFVRAILDAGVLAPSWGSWQVKPGALDALDLPSDVVQLLVRRISGLDQETIKLLRGAAVLGTEFQQLFLPQLVGLQSTQVEKLLAASLAGNLIERSHGQGRFTFVHDRIREALLAPLSPDELRKTHQLAALEIDRHPDATGENVYALANHYAVGDAPETRKRLIETNWAAGAKASREFAYGEAVEFLERAKEAAGEARIEVTYEFYRLLAEACAQMDLVAEAVKYVKEALPRAKTSLQRAEAHHMLAVIYMGNIETRAALKEWNAGMRALGKAYPRNLLSRMLLATYQWIVGLFISNTKKRRTSQVDLLTMKLYDVGCYIAYYMVDALFFTQLALSGLRLANRNTVGPEVVASYGIYAMMWSSIDFKRVPEKYAQKAIDLAMPLGDKVTLARCSVRQGWISNFAGDYLTAERRHAKFLKDQGRWLDLHDFVSCCGDYSHNLKVRGRWRRSAAVIDAYFARVRQAKTTHMDQLEGHSHVAAAAGVYAALGRMPEATATIEKVRKNVERINENFTYLLYYEGLVHYNLEQNELGRPMDEAIDKLLSLKFPLGRLGQQPFTNARQPAVMVAYARIAQLRAALAKPATGDSPAAERQKEVKRRKKQFRQALRNLLILGRDAGMRAHLWALRGEWARLNNRTRRAERALNKCEAVAERCDNVWAVIESLRTRALMARAAGHTYAAERHAKLAYELCREEGWIRMMSALESEFKLDQKGETGAGTVARSSGGATVAIDSMSTQWKNQLQTLVQAAVSSSSLRDPMAQARQTLDSVIKMLGAERGLLFLKSEDGSSDLEMGRGSEGADLPEVSSYSTTIIRRV
ncbi:MAG: AAA family ATPase, partial [Deltaproteobacteria bacterium]|nr:AAA family ATPase [Deltaproteobacteria bacterium]